jgi:PBP1b-binding outer membrane lipoprotein LpoB
MKKYILIASIIALFTSCASKKAEPVKEEQHQEEATSNFVSLTELQMKTSGIELGTIEQSEEFNQSKWCAFSA